MIQFESVTKKYASHLALEDINLKIEKGEFVFIVGASGAGKSTLLKLITREILPTSGKILFNGEDITKIPNNKIPILRRKIGTIFQDFKLLLSRTIFENVAVPLEVLGYKDADIEREVSQILEKVGILEKANDFPTQLARAIIAKPEVLLADEPTGDLDPKNSLSVVGLLDKISQETQTTVLMATHNAHVVNEFKKRVVVLQKGKIVKDEKEGRYETG